jgi:hypothetical protein
MITDQQWNSLLHLSKSQFDYPDNMQWSIVAALDQFIGIVGSRPEILSTYRPGDPRQHGKGTAIDTAWAGANPLEINQAALDSKLFSGIGVYINPAGVASHHFDTRTDRTVENPARWGGVIEHPTDPDTGTVGKSIIYTSMQDVLDLIKKKLGGATSTALIVLIAIGLILLATRRS